MKDYSDGQSKLMWVMQSYGFLLPDRVDIDGLQFAALIDAAYDTQSGSSESAINYSAAMIVSRVRGTFQRSEEWHGTHYLTFQQGE